MPVESKTGAGGNGEIGVHAEQFAAYAADGGVHFARRATNSLTKSGVSRTSGFRDQPPIRR